MGTSDRFKICDQELAAFCEEHRILKLSLFGSVLTDRFHSGSDIDIVVEFEPGARIGLIKKAEIQLALSDIVGNRVDLRTAAELSPYFRNTVLENAEVRYVRG
jgi:predicted nucleotidyltransferase